MYPDTICLEIGIHTPGYHPRYRPPTLLTDRKHEGLSVRTSTNGMGTQWVVSRRVSVFRMEDVGASDESAGSEPSREGEVRRAREDPLGDPVKVKGDRGIWLGVAPGMGTSRRISVTGGDVAGSVAINWVGGEVSKLGSNIYLRSWRPQSTPKHCWGYAQQPKTKVLYMEMSVLRLDAQYGSMTYFPSAIYENHRLQLRNYHTSTRRNLETSNAWGRVYTAGVMRLCTKDPYVAGVTYSMTNWLAPSTDAFSPAIVAKVLWLRIRDILGM
ncbi:hypothetical protein JB92DRAFT_2835226 [Gautieria morchelliformis]|nr:hypothetical protein JB92DRAFT_2835226 [Gautieria morchelliformis]